MKINCFTKSESEMNALLQEKIGQTASLSNEHIRQIKLLYVSKHSRKKVKFETQIYRLHVEIEKFIEAHLKEISNTMIYKIELAPTVVESKQNTLISYKWAGDELLIAKVLCTYEMADDETVRLQSAQLIFLDVDEERWKKVRLKTLF